MSQFILLDNAFLTLPAIVVQGRKILSNIERVSNLFLTKTVYATLLALFVALVGWQFPFLPRHLTLIGSITIGIPAFFLALAPRAPRYQQGFTRRVARFALPVGTLIAVVTILADIGLRLVFEASPAHIPTLLLLILTALGSWVVIMLARPLPWYMILLFACLFAGLLAIFLFTPLRVFFALAIPASIEPFEVAGIIIISILLLELAWRATARESDQPSS